MSENRSLASKSLVLLVIFVLGLTIGIYWPASGGEDGVKAAADAEAPQFSAWPNELAGRFRSFLLPLNNPSTVPAAMASHMEEDDVVAGLVVNGQARAYPQWILVAYHVVNDTINEAPVLLAHCEICSGTSAFQPVVDGFEGGSLTFGQYGPANGTFSVYDYQTKSVWSPFTGRTLQGELNPSRMKRIPLIVEHWGDWVKRFPETDVIFASRLLIEQREHGRGEHNQLGAEYIPDGFQRVANMGDERLARNALVFGIANVKGDRAMAFPLGSLKEEDPPLKYEFDGHQYLIKKIGEFGVVAFRLEEGQEGNTYHVVSQTPFRLGDDEGRVWDEFGKSLKEEAGSRQLQMADGYFTEWYEWVSSYPHSEIAH